jgi:hypothetical protein
MAEYDWVFDDVVSDLAVLPIVYLYTLLSAKLQRYGGMAGVYLHQNHICLWLQYERQHLCLSVNWAAVGFRK